MQDPVRHARALLREIRRALGSSRETIQPVLPELMPALRELTGSELNLAVETQVRGDALQVGFCAELTVSFWSRL